MLTHAWGLDSRMWNQQIPALVAAGYSCIMPDRRGHGRSDIAAAGYDLDTLAGDVATVVEHLDLDDLVLAGHSAGAQEIVRETHRTLTRVDLRPDLARLEVPVTVIHGTLDASAPIEATGRPTAELVRHGHLVVIDGAGHGMYSAHVEQYNGALLDAARAAERLVV